jgi:luciferase family oxidoreductase group 1
LAIGAAARPLAGYAFAPYDPAVPDPLAEAAAARARDRSDPMDPRGEVAFSLLDLSPIVAGSNAAAALRNTLDLAQHAEGWGYRRYWLAEHHNIPGVASAATSVVIGHVAGGTSRIRVGAGGIMLPNHAPLVIAEQFGTLESLYPGRIDLGIGRAPGGDQRTARALRRHLGNVGADTFPDDLRELIAYFQPAATGASAVRAIPGEGLDVPVYLLGSSDFSASLAAELGLPFAFASHFAPDYLQVAVALYRSQFRPSQWLDRPYVMVGVNVIAADTDDDARRLFTSLQQQFLNLVRGVPREVPPPVESMDGRWSLPEQAHVNRMTRVSAVGSPATVRRDLEALLAATDADELIATAQIYDHAARLRSFELVAAVFRAINAARDTHAQTAPAREPATPTR